MKDRNLTIGTLAARTACKIETIRYYEKIGLLPAPPRSEGGHRVYGEDQVRRLRFIRRGRELGSQILIADAAHTRSDVLTSAAVLAGLIAIAGLVLTALPVWFRDADAGRAIRRARIWGVAVIVVWIALTVLGVLQDRA